MNICGENMSIDDDLWGECTYTLFPKTVETAIKVAKNKKELEDYVGYSMTYYLEVETNLSLLSEAINNQSIKPDEIAKIRMIWYVNPNRSEERVEKEMKRDLEHQLETVGLNLNDFDYDFDCTLADFGV